MPARSRTLAPALALALLTVPAALRAQSSHDYPIQPVPFTSVHLNDVFWAPRIEVNRTVTIPYAFDQCERTERVENFVRAAKALHGTITDAERKRTEYPFDDTDLYKIIEGASYALSVTPDPKLDAYVDGLIAKIAAAQEPDGYLYTSRTVDPQHPHEWSGATRWEKEEILSHELYNLGHLYEAAAAHYTATGKRTLLDVALKSAELLCQTFGPGKRAIYPGHQITEMGLAKLYRITGEKKYLELAKFLLDSRGPKGDAYNQAHERVVDQAEAVGHAVRAAYMYSGMADVAALTGDAAYIKAIDAIWTNVAAKKLYVTGGIGSTGAGEAFGANYELPNMTAYNETCASIGNDYWNQRLFLLHGDAKYVDVLERTLYNALLSGVSLDGKTFFYPNPLESNGQHKRSPWFGCACCPGNVTRFISSVSGYQYAVGSEGVYVNLYAGGVGQIDVKGAKVKLTQTTRYPWDGAVKIAVDPAATTNFALLVRIPGWARNEAMPSDLYRFTDVSKDAVKLTVNGKSVTVNVDKGYVKIARAWKAGDVVELTLPMSVRRVIANEKVEADRGRVALQRGPIVYALEWPDHADGHVRNLVLARDAKLSSEFRPALLGGVEVIRGTAVALSRNAAGELERKSVELTAIPYSTWANRGAGQMEVWIAEDAKVAKPTPYPTLAARSTVSADRVPRGRNPKRVNDGEEPESSHDGGSSFDWWPVKGESVWIEYKLPEASEVSSTSVYWFDDTGRGEVRVPESWRVTYLDGSEWKPVEAKSSYAVAVDRYNEVAFKPVRTTAVRIELKMQQGFSAGISEWKLK